jgi:hypothetical protein
MTPTFTEVVTGELILHNIKLCAGCSAYNSHARGFACGATRTIHMNAKFATRSTLFGFLHEVGHIVDYQQFNKWCGRRWELEARATLYAINSMRAYDIPIPKGMIRSYRAYTARCKRHGQNVSQGLRKARSRVWTYNPTSVTGT